ncbi:hypothetical protein [Legionella gresilensis]|uniref:hypothetical protein n=1 Tax=Legionella gresilensis TaxID=91823 RepID=UPI001041776D|nr:hypothetical protein [Legionella gresilensis]
MSNFETEYLHAFYKSFINVITPLEIEKALRNFQTIQDKNNPKRYSGMHTFNLIGWKPMDAEKFTAALAETFARATEQFIDTQDAETIHNMTEKIRAEYIPKLVRELDPENPFLKLSQQLKMNLEKLPKKENTSIFNEYSFFGGAVVLLGAAVIYNYSPRQ